ncbi:hypothetical protein TRFO_24965 [Tritrichomonas foetus]|uniref:EGF-like domain-containing protein n=1 Tax=Tritrichomonas foetus TaxID=1144522 RepID=A0A1J4K7Q8_9EUKA|nr:hypothetical protein TRFO_24965 [Tritrichomonas foetus]|eukprot:OHT06920.1 hypothetical protein TRFO_24965 [Tritrichomonas foetus]
MIDEIDYSLYYDDDDFPEDQDINCTYPNTFKDDGFCSCIEGFEGDPYDPNGCYKCMETCGENAECVFPGTCKCMMGYEGNPTKKCEIILPKILNMSTNFSFVEGGTLVTVSYSYNNVGPFSAFCKFGDRYVNAEITNTKQKFITCRAPPKQPQIVNFYISFDGHHWSTEDVKFEYKIQFTIVNIVPFVFLYFGLIGVIALILYCSFRKKIMQPTKEEKEPFFNDPERPRKRRQRARRRGHL